MKLSRKLLVELANAHARLDGAPEAGYKFGPTTRYRLAKNLRILRGVVEDIDKARVGLVRQIWPDGMPAKDTPEMTRFTIEWQLFLDAEDDVKNLMTFSLADLNLEANHIPVTVLASLGPVINEEGS